MVTRWFWLTLFLPSLTAQEMRLVLDPLLPARQFVREDVNEDVLPSDSVNGLLQTTDGYLWIGSFGGLARFNGNACQVFTSRDNPYLLGGIWDMAEAPDGTLWIGTNGGGLASFADGTFRGWNSDDGLPSNQVRSVLVARDGSIWIGTGEGLCVLRDNQIQPVTNVPLDHAAILDLHEDSEGNIWIGTRRHGLFRHAKEAFHPLGTSFAGLQSAQILALAEDSEGSLWVGTDAGAACWDGSSWQSLSQKEGLPGKQVSSLLTCSSGAVYMITEAGVVRFYQDTLDLVPGTAGLAPDLNGALEVDREGGLWVGTWGKGAIHLTVGKFEVRRPSEAYESLLLNAVFERPDNAIWIATSRGVFQPSGDSGLAPVPRLNALRDIIVWDIFEGQGDEVYFATEQGLYLLQEETLTRFSEESGLPTAMIRTGLVDSRGRHWIGTRAGLALRQGNRFRSVSEHPILNLSFILGLFEDSQGNIWVSTDGSGVILITPDDQYIHLNRAKGLSGDIIFRFAEDNKGRVWIGGVGGITIYENGQLFRAPEETTVYQGLSDDAVFHILLDDFDRFWATTTSGILTASASAFLNHVKGDEGLVQERLYSRPEGLPSRGVTSVSKSLQDASGILWFPTPQGLASINPARVRLNRVVPVAKFEALLVDNLNLLQSPLTNGGPFVLPAGSKRIAIRFAGLSYEAPSNNRSRLLLYGFDDSTRYYQGADEVVYTNLDPKSYKFVLHVSNNDGLWNEQPAQLEFRIAPFFYETTWFAVLMVIGALGLGYLTYLWRVRAWRRRNLLLERQVAERTQHIEHQKTALQEINEKLFQAKSEAEANARYKSEFLANMSHEMRTPMNAIVGLGHLLSKTSLNPKQSDYLRKILSSSKSLLGIINDVLDFSKIEAGKIELERIDFDLSQVLSNLLDITQHRAEEKGLKLLLQRAPDVPERLNGDPFRLGQILLNLVGNAIKFTDQGCIKVNVQRQESSRPNHTILLFEVVDSGIGMSEEQMARLFKAFSQADSSTTRRFGGTGLGLAICQRFVELMEGEIGARSEIGKGSTFHFTATFAPASTPSLPDAEEVVAPTAPRIPEARLLLVEDHDINQQVAIELLALTEAKVTIASNGQEALDLLAKEAFDLIFMDLQMPVLDGYTATRRIRQNKAFDRIPIVAMTANAIQGDRENCLAIGMNDYISKPIDPVELYQTIARWIPRNKSENAPRDSSLAVAPPPDPGLPVDLPGIHLPTALRYSGGRQDLLSATLQRFAERFQDGFIPMIRLLQEGHREEARRFAHTLKGLAGSLGAQELRESAGAIEAILEKPHGALPQNLLQTAEQAISTVLASIRNLHQNQTADQVPEATESLPLSHPSLRNELTRLMEALSQDDASAPELAAALLPKLLPTDREKLSNIIRLIDDFEFDAALETLREHASSSS